MLLLSVLLFLAKRSRDHTVDLSMLSLAMPLMPVWLMALAVGVAEAVCRQCSQCRVRRPWRSSDVILKLILLLPRIHMLLIALFLIRMPLILLLPRIQMLLIALFLIRMPLILLPVLLLLRLVLRLVLIRMPPILQLVLLQLVLLPTRLLLIRTPPTRLPPILSVVAEMDTGATSAAGSVESTAPPARLPRVMEPRSRMVEPRVLAMAAPAEPRSRMVEPRVLAMAAPAEPAVEEGGGGEAEAASPSQGVCSILKGPSTARCVLRATNNHDEKQPANCEAH
jgi:hypothetical protein